MDSNKKSYFLYEANLTMSRQSCIEFICLTAFFSIPSVFIGGFSVLVILFSLLLVLIYIKSMYGKFDDQKVARGHHNFLNRGMLCLYWAYTFFVTDLRILLWLYPEKYHFVIILLSFVLVIIILAIYAVTTSRMIKKNKFDRKAVPVGAPLAPLWALLGISLMKIFDKALDTNEEAFSFLAICCLVLLSVGLLGTLNLYKYYCIIRTPELLEAVEEMLKNEKAERIRIRQKKDWVSPTDKRKMDREQKRKHRGNGRSH